MLSRFFIVKCPVNAPGCINNQLTYSAVCLKFW